MAAGMFKKDAPAMRHSTPPAKLVVAGAAIAGIGAAAFLVAWVAGKLTETFSWRMFDEMHRFGQVAAWLILGLASVLLVLATVWAIFAPPSQRLLWAARRRLFCTSLGTH